MGGTRSLARGERQLRVAVHISCFLLNYALEASLTYRATTHALDTNSGTQSYWQVGGGHAA